MDLKDRVFHGGAPSSPVVKINTRPAQEMLRKKRRGLLIQRRPQLLLAALKKYGQR
jgi:hypothetical protein